MNFQRYSKWATNSSYSAFVLVLETVAFPQVADRPVFNSERFVDLEYRAFIVGYVPVNNCRLAVSFSSTKRSCNAPLEIERVFEIFWQCAMSIIARNTIVEIRRITQNNRFSQICLQLSAISYPLLRDALKIQSFFQNENSKTHAIAGS